MLDRIWNEIVSSAQPVTDYLPDTYRGHPEAVLAIGAAFIVSTGGLDVDALLSTRAD
jgi:hypothetical protein